MANEKISAMPAAPQPFNGSEKFPLIGSGGANDSATFAALVYEILNNGLSGVFPATVTIENGSGSQLILAGDGSVIFNNAFGAGLSLNAAGQAFLSDTVGSLLALDNDGSLGLQNESGANLYFDAYGNVSLADAFAGLGIVSGIVNFDNYPTFTPGSFSGSVTTASLVGKTMTFTNGLLTSFS